MLLPCVEDDGGKAAMTLALRALNDE